MKIYPFIVCFLVSMIAIGQTNPMELYLIGNSNFKAGNYEKAIENYTELMTTMDEPIVQKTCYINRGLSYDRLQKYDLAIEDFTTAIKMDSTDMASFIDRGLSNMHAGNPEKAILDFNHVIQLKSNQRMTQNAIYWKSQIHYTLLEFQETIKDCDQYIVVNPNDPEMYFIRGSANSMLRNFEQSIKDYDKAIKLNPNYVQAIANRGTAKINLLTGNGNLQPSKRETKGACKDLKKAKAMGDNSVDDLIYVYCGN